MKKLFVTAAICILASISCFAQPPIAISTVAPLDLHLQAGIMVEVTLQPIVISMVVQQALPRHL